MRRLDQPVTADELLRMPDTGVRRELVRGEVREMTPAGGEHGFITGELHTLLGTFVRGKRLGRVSTAETGFLLARDPDTVLAPDIAFVREERLPAPLPRGFLELAPDLVVETRSPGDSSRSIAEKVEQWLASGVRSVWVVDPDHRTITVHRGSILPRVLGEEDQLDGEDVIPGFCCRVGEVFV